ncbi:MAG: exodeoxyribonuclease VII small subunit [Bacteroidales bacterium]|nr:exodeoxyribonuclease VII small subunit [Bacteroidales bacterium]MCI6101489.1 exodeoxyribonuclease VII small subunit [Bacteroidales bacterium]MDD7705551.1 exodeoxyribonuclease VII small subunit [Bacteroidales bacterium]
MKQPTTFEEATARLEAIVRRMEDGQLNLDEITSQLKEAKQLVKFCRDKLTKTEKEVNDILKDSSISPTKGE